MSLLVCRCRILMTQAQPKQSYFYIKRCYKSKKKSSQTSTSATNRALEHFDLYYRPVYGKLWPSIRIALLTAKKRAAVMNNFVEDNIYYDEFIDKGAYDIILRAAEHQMKLLDGCKDSVDDIRHENELVQQSSEVAGSNTYTDVINKNLERRTSAETEHDDDINSEITSVTVDEEDRKDLDRTNLFGFVPAKTVYSESHMLRLEEAEKSKFTPMDIQVTTVKPHRLSLPSDLEVLTFPSGDISTFSEPKVNKPGGYLCFYMMDAASVLPVIALDLQKNDSVLDLCAAPGGKSLSMLQTNSLGSLSCNDLSGSRVARLLNVLRYYVPKEYGDDVTVTKRSGLTFNEPLYDKVLVDVPCNTDRHMLLEDENNLFSPSRLGERLELPTIQKDLLMSGIKSCRPGGSIMYSTCTLSPAQNDGIVQQAFDEIWRHTNIDIVVEDLTEMTDIFKDTFNFFKNCRFGQLVIPSLSSNFGPMYFCKIKRIN